MHSPASLIGDVGSPAPPRGGGLSEKQAGMHDRCRSDRDGFIPAVVRVCVRPAGVAGWWSEAGMG